MFKQSFQKSLSRDGFRLPIISACLKYKSLLFKKSNGK